MARAASRKSSSANFGRPMACRIYILEYEFNIGYTCSRFATEHADAEPSPERCSTTTAGGRATARRGPPDDRRGAVFLGRDSGGGGCQCTHRSGAAGPGWGGFLDPLVSDPA